MISEVFIAISFSPNLTNLKTQISNYKTHITMNQKHQAKVEKRNAKQEKQAQMVIWGIIIGLIVLALAFVITYSMSF